MHFSNRPRILGEVVACPLQFVRSGGTDMPRDTKEPQSYGSQGDWASGKTGQQPNDPKSEPPIEQADFYDSRPESDGDRKSRGGRTSEVQLSDEPRKVVVTSSDAFRGPTTQQDSGAKRDGFFKERDYPES
jgi:hypothetical protein